MESENLLTEEELKALLDPGPGTTDDLKMDLKLKMVLDFPLEISVRLGEAEMTVGQILNLAVGTVIELDTMVFDPVDLKVNGQSFAQGEVITIGETFGVRLVNISKTEERIKNLG